MLEEGAGWPEQGRRVRPPVVGVPCSEPPSIPQGNRARSNQRFPKIALDVARAGEAEDKPGPAFEQEMHTGEKSGDPVRGRGPV